MSCLTPELTKLSLTVIALAGLCLGGCAPTEPAPQGSLPDVRRLTESQYRNIIADVFGSAIVVGGRFDTPVRTEGLLAVGARNAAMTPSSLIQFDAMARSIAAQVVSEPNRRFLVPCEITNAAPYDAACTQDFIGELGLLLFRRPLSGDELATRLTIVEETTRALGSFAEGLAAGLTSLLVSPQFLFVIDRVQISDDEPDTVSLDAFSIASRLSFLLWNTGPDRALLAAAQTGELLTDAGREQQVQRLMNSPRLENGVRAFFGDMLQFSEFSFLEKDSVIYPAFGIAAALHAKEQTLRTIVDHVVAQDRDYRELFVTRKTFMTRTLGLVYRLQVKAPEGVWEPYEFAADSPRQGIQEQVGFLALNSHPGRSSATLRGKAIREMLLCQKVPAPPPDVDFSEFNDPESKAITARERLAVHSTNAACAGCHKITDPIGLAMENYDGAGQFRDTDDGVPIDSSGDLDGVAFADSSGFGPALRDNPATTACLVNRLYAYASGQTLAARDPWIQYLEKSFAADNFRVTALLQRIATSRTFYAITTPAPLEQRAAIASNLAVAE